MSDVLRVEKITFWEGVAMIIGTNIGAGILGVSYAARHTTRPKSPHRYWCR